LEEEIKKYDKTILICNVGFRMRLNQEEMIRDLDKQVQNNLQVFYLLKQGAGSYDVKGCRAQQVNVFLHDIDERFIEKSLKDLINRDSVRRRIKLMILFLLFIGLLAYGYVHLKSALEETEAKRHEKLDAETFLSQNYRNLIQASKRLFEKSFEIQQDSLQENEQRYCVQNGDLEEFKKLIVILERDNLENQEKKSHKIFEEIRDRSEQELKQNQKLQKFQIGNLEMKELIEKLNQKNEESQDKLFDHKNKTKEGIQKFRNQVEEALRDLEKVI